jgi:hypothetical protein
VAACSLIVLLRIGPRFRAGRVTPRVARYIRADRGLGSAQRVTIGESEGCGQSNGIQRLPRPADVAGVRDFAVKKSMDSNAVPVIDVAGCLKQDRRSDRGAEAGLGHAETHREIVRSGCDTSGPVGADERAERPELHPPQTWTDDLRRPD